MNREGMHNLIERIPDDEVSAAQRFLEYLVVSPAVRPVQTAPPDDEPVTADDETAIARAHADVEASRVTSHEAVLREFGVR